MRKPEVDEYRKLDDRDQDEGQGNALFDDRNDNEYRDYRYRVDYLEVAVGSLDHVLHAGCLTDEHTLFVVFLEDGVKAVDLSIYLISRNLVFGVDKH